MTNTPELSPASLPLRWVVMGVSGCGKSTVGKALASRLQAEYVEGDDYHLPASIRKMSEGIPLDDEDRHGWLLQLQELIRQSRQRGTGLVVSCSALKRRYRDMLRQGDPNLIFLHLDGPRELIAARMKTRTKHFMPQDLLDSQYRDLEPLQADERGMQLDVREPPDALVNRAVHSYQAA